MSRRVKAILGVLVTALLAGCARSAPEEDGGVIEPRLVAGFGLPVNVDRDAYLDLPAYARAILQARWEDAFEFSGSSAEAGYSTVTDCSALLSDDVSLGDVAPMYMWNTIQVRDRRCRAAALVADSAAATRTDWPDQILTPAAPQQLPAEVMTRISREQDESFAKHIAGGRARWVQHEPVEFVTGNGDAGAEFVTDHGMRYWLSVVARADITRDGAEDVLMQVSSAPDGGSYRSYKLLVLEVVDGVWQSTGMWEAQ